MNKHKQANKANKQARTQTNKAQKKTVKKSLQKIYMTKKERGEGNRQNGEEVGRRERE